MVHGSNYRLFRIMRGESPNLSPICESRGVFFKNLYFSHIYEKCTSLFICCLHLMSMSVFVIYTTYILIRYTYAMRYAIILSKLTMWGYTLQYEIILILLYAVYQIIYQALQFNTFLCLSVYYFFFIFQSHYKTRLFYNCVH